MDLLGYISCLADPDLWPKESMKDSGDKYYKYILLYVEDALTIGENPESQLMELDKYFSMKPGSVGKPKMYLGARLTNDFDGS